MGIRVLACLFSILIFSITLTESAFGDTEYNIYIDPLPDWADHASNVMYEATKFWEDANPGLKFYQVDNELQADFSVQWVKEFGVEHVGYAYGSYFVEVGLGDSNCGEKWQPYSSNYVADIMKHEIGHVLKLEHSSDPYDIMYPIAAYYEYGLVEDQIPFTENYGWFIPVCSFRDVTSFNYHVSTEDPKYGFDVYFVPSDESLDLWGEGKSFEYYADSECHGTNYLQYGGTCENVAGNSGLLILSNQLTDPLTYITVQLQEVPEKTVVIGTPAIGPSQSDEQSDSTFNIGNSYDLYVDKKQQFSIKYPSNWIIDDIKIYDEYQVSFFDKENWSSYIMIEYYEGIEYTGFSDNEILEEIEFYEREYCNVVTYELDGFVCYNFDVLDTDIIQLKSGLKSYVIGYTTIRQYSDPLFPGQYSIVTTVNEIHDGKNAWLVVTETDDFAFETYSNNLIESVNSFKLIKPATSPPDQTPTFPEPIPVPTPSPTPQIIASENLGTVKIDQTTFEVGPYETVQVKIYGTVLNVNKGDRIALTFTYPDGTTDGNLVFATKQGYFENYLILDKNSPRGKYEVLVLVKRQILDILEFEVIDKGTSPIDSQNIFESPASSLETSQKVPDWIKNNAKWWSDGQIGDTDFVSGIQFMIKEKIINIPNLPEQASVKAEEKVPDWIRNNAGWWADGQISEDDFVNGIKYLVEKGIIKV